jgi:translation elongation factor EF-Tu-like GTPase
MANEFELLGEDVFTISGRGSVIAGKILSGRVRIGDRVLASTADTSQSCTVTAVQIGSELVNDAESGATVGLLLRGFDPKKLPADLPRRDDGSLGGLRVRSLPPGYVAPAGAKPWWKFW